MNRITEKLRDTYDRLDLPQPARSRILLEIAGDLEGLKAHFLKEGHGEHEAEQRALDMCDLSEESIRQLVKVHAGGYRRFLERFSAQAQDRWEGGMLVAVLAAIALIAGRAIVSTRLIEHAGNLVWPILGLTFLAVILLLPKYYAVFLRQDHRVLRLRSCLVLVPGIAGACLLMGFLGFWLGLYALARRASQDFEETLPFVIHWLMTGSAMLMLCLLSVIVILVLWFILSKRIARIEEAEAAVLITDD
jgi:hypothetical protein